MLTSNIKKAAANLMSDSISLQHENRMGRIYHLVEGKTSTGKPKYYTSRKPSGKPLAAMPLGYEFYERPDTAQVLVRKDRSVGVTQLEREQTEQIVRRASGLEHFVVDVEEAALVVYTPAASRADADKLFDLITHGIIGRALAGKADFRNRHIKNSPYIKMLRFELVNPNTREFSAERWCFRGSIDNWIPLGGYSGHLAKARRKIREIPRPGGFFELM